MEMLWKALLFDGLDFQPPPALLSIELALCCVVLSLMLPICHSLPLHTPTSRKINGSDEPVSKAVHKLCSDPPSPCSSPIGEARSDPPVHVPPSPRPSRRDSAATATIAVASSRDSGMGRGADNGALPGAIAKEASVTTSAASAATASTASGLASHVNGVSAAPAASASAALGLSSEPVPIGRRTSSTWRVARTLTELANEQKEHPIAEGSDGPCPAPIHQLAEAFIEAFKGRLNLPDSWGKPAKTKGGVTVHSRVRKDSRYLEWRTQMAVLGAVRRRL